MKSVARSTTEAEYVGMGEATKAALWGRRLLAELEGKGEQAVPLLLGDNKGAVQLTRGVSNTSKSSILIQHFITLLMRSRKVEYKSIGSQGKICWQME